MSTNEHYNPAFYADQVSGSQVAARIVLPLLFRDWLPGSLVDVGCGLGTWSAAARELGVANCVGIDGSYVQPDALLIPRDAFIAHDLEAPLPAHLGADMAICIEVAEHLSASRAPGLVEDLCRIAPVVLFSAGVPYQGGSGHVNEHWPEYWAAMFAQFGFLPYDPVRDLIWGDARVPWWYRQNLIIFARPEIAGGVAMLGQPAQASALARIHPELFLTAVHRRRLQAPRTLGDDLEAYQRAVAGQGAPAGYGMEFDVVLD
ncbi:methyltransferase domain-containing protein [Novosphingobium bradum]|uniref:Methyltransferase domain-containing protein n=1 Tax=Novosphingobium bradum TaxID=1737444 RepID=A0ABV7IPX2_9SPHN